MDTEQLKDELEDLERAGWDSLCDGTGSDFYGRMMTRDGVMVLATGMALDRDGVVESLREAPPWDGYELADQRVVGAGDDAASLVYRGTGRRADGPDLDAAMTSTYVRTAHGWRLALYTQTPVTD